ncbi:hypothetical protein GCM10027038_19040 [Arthrobacter bambusae]
MQDRAGHCGDDLAQWSLCGISGLYNQVHQPLGSGSNIAPLEAGNNDVPDLAASQVSYEDARGSRPERDTDNVPRRAGDIQIRGGPSAPRNGIDSLLNEETVKKELIHLPGHRRLTQTRQFDQPGARQGCL